MMENRYYIGLYFPPIMENQMEKKMKMECPPVMENQVERKMENEMEPGDYIGGI